MNLIRKLAAISAIRVKPFLWLLLSVFQLLSVSVFAQSNITATVTVTNSAGITNGNTFTVGATTWTVTNSTLSARYIYPTNTAAAAATNVYNKVSNALTNRYFFTYTSASSFTIKTRSVGDTLSVSATGGWASVTLATNAAGGASIGSSNITATSITLGGETRTNWPAGGSGTTYTNNATGLPGVIDAATSSIGSNATSLATAAGLTTVSNQIIWRADTNYGPALTTNFNTFFIANGTPVVVVRSNYTSASLLSGVFNWTNHNGLVLVTSNAFTLDGLPAYAFQTNDGTLKTTTNTVLYWSTNLSAGYPSGTFNKGGFAGATAPSFSITAFLTATNNTSVLPVVVAPSAPQNLVTSNSIYFEVETWGSDTLGRLGVYPFKSYGDVNYLKTNTTPYPIKLGIGWHTNISGTLGFIPRAPLLPQQVLRGMGSGVTFVGFPQGTNVQQSIGINNSNVIRDMTIMGMVSAANADSSLNITNLLMENVVFGNSNNIDNVFFGGTGVLTEAQFNNVQFNSAWDTMNGVATATFSGCSWQCIGATNSAVASIASLRPIYLQGTGPTNNLTIIGGRMFAGIPYATPLSGQGCFVLNNTNCALKILGMDVLHGTNLPVFNVDVSAGVTLDNCKYINGYYRDIALSADLSTVLSVNLVTVSNGVFRTNYTDASQLTGTLPQGSLPSSVVTNRGVFDGSGLTNLNASNLASGTIPSARLTGVTVSNATLAGATAITGNLTNGYVVITNAANTNIIALDNSDGFTFRVRNNSSTLFTINNAAQLNPTSGYLVNGTQVISSGRAANFASLITSGTITATNGFIVPTNWPSITGYTNGTAGTVNSNGTIFLVTSKVGATNQLWTKIADAAP